MKENKNSIEGGDKVMEKPKDNLNILLEANRENLYSNISLENLGLGLGLRASLPKMPSFRRKKIPSSPVREDEDSRKLSDNEEIVHDDSDGETARPLQRVRHVSTSSSSSSESSDETSDSESSSTDESSDESEVIINDGIEASNKTPEPMQIDATSQEVAPQKLVTTAEKNESDEEREYLERRRRNTEWMEQIERERESALKAEVETKENVAIDVLVQMAVKKPNENIALAAAEEEEEVDVKMEDLNGSVDVAAKTLSESSGDSSPSVHVAMEHSYCMPPEQEEELPPPPPPEVTKEFLTHDHIYTSKAEEEDEEEERKPVVIKEKPSRPRKPKHNSRKLQDIQNTTRYQQPPQKSYDMKHRERDMVAEMGVLFEFLTKGIDQEDINYMRQSYEAMLADDSIGYWLNDTHWVDHCITDLYSCPPKRRKRDETMRIHTTGCARTEGFYKIEAYEKAKYKHHHAKAHANTSPEIPVTKMQGK